MAPPHKKEVRRRLDQDILNDFIEQFRFLIAVTPKEKSKVFALRHKVFLQEFHYAMHEDQSHHFETDTYDNSSIHCLIEHKRTGLSAGCMRLIVASCDSSSPFYRLPLEIQGRKKLNHPSLTPHQLPRHKLCEVSRLAISKEFRSRHSKEFQSPIILQGQEFSHREAQAFPLIAIGLFLCTYSLVGLTSRRHVFAMMDSGLPRLLSFSGFHFTRVSDEIIYHGRRHAYYIDHEKAEKEMHRKLLPLYLHIQRELSPQLEELPIEETSVSCSC